MLEAVIKGLVLGTFLAISVGPVIFAILKQSINNGHKAGYYFVAGISASDILLVVVCNLFSSLFTAVISHKTAIAVLGSIFLVGLGIYTLFFKKVQTDEENKIIQRQFKAHHFAGFFASGFLINILNPAVFFFWLVWSSAVSIDSQTAKHPLEYRMIVFGTCLLFVLLTDIAKVALASQLRSRMTPKVLRIFNKISGLILIGFAVALVFGVLVYGDKMSH